MRCLALDIGGTKIASAIVENNLISQRKQTATPLSTATDISPQNVVAAMHQILADIVKAYQGQFDYIAVASTGIINQGILTALNPKNLGGLAEFPLHASLSQHTDKPVGLLNDAQAATAAEYQIEDQNQVQNFAFITVSTGVGGGIVLERHLLTQPRGIAGHIGHSLADINGPVCGCGRLGCVEAIASGRAIEAISNQWNPPLSPKQVFVEFHKNNPNATALIARSAKTIANLVADLTISLDLQKIAIGGSIGLAEGYLPLVKQYLKEMPAFYQSELRLAKYGQDAGLIGAAAWVKTQLIHL